MPNIRVIDIFGLYRHTIIPRAKKPYFHPLLMPAYFVTLYFGKDQTIFLFDPHHQIPICNAGVSASAIQFFQHCSIPMKSTTAVTLMVSAV